MNRISVVIPTYNRPQYINTTVDMVLRQTHPPYEIIVVDNGTEPCQLEQDFPDTVRLYRIMSRAGAAQARNFGACMAGGEFIAFLDDDDIWEAQYLEKIQKVIDEDKPDLVVAKLDKLLNGEVLPFKNPVNTPRISGFIYQNPGYTGSSVTIRKSAFIERGGYDPRFRNGQDKEIAINFLMNGKKIVHAPEAQAIIRLHADERLTYSNNFITTARLLREKYPEMYNSYIYLKSLRQALTKPKQTPLKDKCAAALLKVCLGLMKPFYKRK
ncbi:glycosyltransferase family A protein [Hahella aquimaris]|uniref:glycosyltransferase family 2 protein n=1 Tax=Hahella sp. HNIBRBA332 TaxID=3015983 RepID=UPI00273C921C|nr:glycosyltransferase family A protein [Hahella sp. HNIBRBA332]WLQ12213.1 glycosyltransferase family A protein [Hahella sp. HNIBRBA332]